MAYLEALRCRGNLTGPPPPPSWIISLYLRVVDIRSSRSGLYAIPWRVRLYRRIYYRQTHPWFEV
ncbi:hypothetical protein KY290_035976 [Solanum tuberosum]|uniref:Uncharacterized protein n=1 Tax=Solanum tuberosum TaxID=4113 RepID=A0ABQ7TRV1_SOLTU|nr:hypothetical protein KY290_035976 [Solanum tuberosum]